MGNQQNTNIPLGVKLVSQCLILGKYNMYKLQYKCTNGKHIEDMQW